MKKKTPEELKKEAVENLKKSPEVLEYLRAIGSRGGLAAAKSMTKKERHERARNAVSNRVTKPTGRKPGCTAGPGGSPCGVCQACKWRIYQQNHREKLGKAAKKRGSKGK